MIGQAQFTYTDQDMIATQRAGWTWCARGRNLLIAFVAFVALESAVLAGLNLAYGTRGVPADPVFVVLASAALTVLIFGLFFVIAGKQGRQVLRSAPRQAWDGDELGGEHAWTWDDAELHLRNPRGRVDLPWSVVGAWLDAPDVLLLFPSGGRPFSLPKAALAAGWRDAPKVFLLPYGGYALTLPKRALASGDARRLVDVLRAAGAQERRRFGLLAAKG